MTKRRDKGEGSVYRRNDGRCIGEYEDANGKKRYISGRRRRRYAKSYASYWLIGMLG
jgi:hypothetical protein